MASEEASHPGLPGTAVQGMAGIIVTATFGVECLYYSNTIVTKCINVKYLNMVKILVMNIYSSNVQSQYSLCIMYNL